MKYFLLYIVLGLLARECFSFHASNTKLPMKSRLFAHMTKASPSQMPTRRSDALSNAHSTPIPSSSYSIPSAPALRWLASGMMVAFISMSLIPSSVLADDDASKSRKSFELCLSKCMYDGTRPPPINSDNDRLAVTKDRTEILRDCKSKCAVNKDQLLLGKPKPVKSSEASQER
jgi:hypothetical protein